MRNSWLKSFRVLFSSFLLLLPLACSVSLRGNGTSGSASPSSLEPSRNGDSSAATTARVDIMPLAVDKKATQSDVEIIWRVPVEQVEGFEVNFGFARNKMDEKVRVYAQDLEQIEDPLHGPVYRFVLGNIPLNQPLFIAIAAFTEEKTSPPSDIFEVKAQ
ncbi:MAG: hypothetical protein J5J00_00425 [Deltaproteobacteria bacterium]|nr:hypothetical protein [Deltaproteobacteria bacterium]